MDLPGVNTSGWIVPRAASVFLTADMIYPWGEEVGEKELLVTDTSHVA